MIKFFRHIRKSMIKDLPAGKAGNKASKYLLYAMGEIILVVIGILIALQINNWNENRKSKIEEKAILESLHENLILANHQSKTLILEEKSLKQLLIVVLGVETIPAEIERRIISDSIFKSAVWDLQSNLPIINTYVNLKNTNKLSLIKNKTINEKFTDLDFQFHKLNDALEDRLSVHQIRIDDILEKDVNFILLVKSNVPEISIANESPNNYNEILNDKRVRNLLGMKLSFTQDIIDRRIELDKDMMQLTSLIEAELIE